MLEQSPYKEDANLKNYNNTLKVKDGVIIIDHSNTSDNNNNNSKTTNTKKNTQKDNNNIQKNQPNLSNDNTLKTKTPNSNTPSLKNTSKEESIHKVSFSFHITNKNINFKDLGLDEQVLQEALNDYKKESISVQDLQDIANIISYYVQVSGYPAATAYIPQQELKDQIQINITLGVLGKYVVQNNSSVRDYAIESKLPNHKGEIITTKLVEDAVYKVNEMYGIQTLASLKAGDNLGDTDVVIETTPSDSFVSVLFYGDNYGIKESGRYRGGASMSFNNIAHQGDSLNAYLQRSDEAQTNYGISYTTFLGNLKITPSYSKRNYALGGAYKNANFIGTSENLGIDLKYPLWITTYNSFYLTSSYYHKKLSNSRLNIMTIDKSSDTISFGIEGVYNGISNDSFSYSANVSYGNVKDRGTTILGMSSKTDGDGFGKFAKLNVNLNNAYFLNDTFTHLFSLNYQQVVNGATLDSSETISLGDPYGVRAYNNGDGKGDNAVVASFGLRMATPLKDFYITPFYDISYSWYENDSKLYRASETNYMDAYGLQLLYNKTGNFYVKLDLARALKKYKLDDDYSSKAYVIFRKYF
ncbi:ShlB/FhaC/HecB family hemolysin secretion/activation protein [Campylobacter jejuni]|uniref:ShlB/FhaC/HecB family hemolysin secretion/activation protein n=2 Tax=Campylobacter jejuni TaxID=197 RepID=UPI001246FE87|nr:ShlB/FhaC/HecB family hemolysin secretion/activation protein [Campylobacter jejuni]EAH8100902.1 ShlB/FhaC/HecB family hemolysin secretion/activation protein [Campylobacter jejuni]EAH9928320.1 ShlB/FhaC/HecB family hemolysin secretion/activation protein [Campylobacter jejuni]EAI2457214.1 ShlB/FhaC/HecB family hemolysin secretion/activation protein [Campylobacter jejuni]EAI2897133.1 ShlB/FhaC/HecB family hemolysin secretion/activation protein [Campylobacter jejuni]EAI3234525.1 ShlB/FhaC/HecB 